MRTQIGLLMIFFVLVIGCQKQNPIKIDREKVVRRHNVRLGSLNILSPLSVGNGHFCYTADITGMQTFTDTYKKGIPLTTMAEWGWHSFPNPDEYKLQDTYYNVDTYGRKVPYPINTGHQGSNWLRSDPHQITPGLAGLQIRDEKGDIISYEQLNKIDQKLDLWNGTLVSHFDAGGEPVSVTTIAHPEYDQVSFKIQSELLGKRRIAIKITFPYASGLWGADPADYENDDLHETEIFNINENTFSIARKMDDKKYYCHVKTSVKCDIRNLGKHIILLEPEPLSQEFELNILFNEKSTQLSPVSFSETMKVNIKSWQNFWQTGGFLDLSASRDTRWKELERRVILSQYLTAVQSRQKYPPQETGLTCNSWYGKFHLEMHWWHSVHFALWGRPEYLEKTMDYYYNILLSAQDFAASQGYKGARWPKMTGPGGIDSPSGVGPLLIWQQPHPLYYAELIYRYKPTPETLEKYHLLIEKSAEFMADFVVWNEERECFELGPPLISAREFSGSTYADNKNPTFELAYWSWGLRMANQWKKRMGKPENKEWNHIADNMAPWPVKDGVYIEQESVPVADGGHPCQLAAFGFLPECESLDKEIMRTTLKHVMNNWDWESTWGWDYPLIAMTAARLGEPELAVEALLTDVTKNTYLPNGHNYQRDDLKIYLPGNGGLLSAVAMMCAGWEGAPESHAPGFPDSNEWVVRWEGLKPFL
ncbi:MAG: hypothetical protein PHS48_09140 [Bacteroidales bacterium]|nr:hypothetical protein [Bacteroidales bacterium]